jgi:glycerol-3-phosphate acyltransferase PlsY
VFLLDAGKGLLSGIIAALLYQQFVATDPSTLVYFYPRISSAGAQSMLSAAFFGCILGHVFSPWLGFKGGKGIATAVGCAFMTLGWLPSVCLLALFALGVLVTRYVSVSSLVAAFACALCAVWVFWGNYGAIATSVIACTFLIWSHRANIKRLMQGTEPRVGKRKEEGSNT